MKCQVCKHEVEQGRARCPVCGFPVIQMVEGDTSEEEKRDELAKNYRRRKLENVSISLKVYTNAMEDGDIRITDESFILLAEKDALIGDEIIWYPEKFARLTGDCILRIEVANVDGQIKEQDIRIENPDIMDFWQVGVLPLEGFQCRIILGSREKYSISDIISYL